MWCDGEQRPNSLYTTHDKCCTSVMFLWKALHWCHGDGCSVLLASSSSPSALSSWTILVSEFFVFTNHLLTFLTPSCLTALLVTLWSFTFVTWSNSLSQLLFVGAFFLYCCHVQASFPACMSILLPLIIAYCLIPWIVILPKKRPLLCSPIHLW